MIDPRGMTFQSWACQTVPRFMQYGFIPTPQGEKNWKQWASYIVGLSQLSAINPPRPESYKEWRDWAVRFNGSVVALGL